MGLFFLKRFIYLFRERERERERERQRNKQALCRKPDVGLDPGTPGSCPGPKAGAKLLRHQGCPVGPFLRNSEYAGYLVSYFNVNISAYYPELLIKVPSSALSPRPFVSFG